MKSEGRIPKDWTNNYFRAVYITRVLGIISPLVAVTMFVLDTFDYIELEVMEVSIVFALIMMASFFFTLIYARKDSSIFFLSMAQSFGSAIYFGMFIFFSEPVTGFRENYVKIIVIQMVIYGIVLFALTKSKEKSFSAFNGEIMNDKKRPETLFTVNSKPTSGEYGPVLALCAGLVAVPFVWYYIAVENYNLPPSGVAFIGGFFWAISLGCFIAAVSFPIVTRRKELIVSEAGIIETCFLGLVNSLITWDEIESMDFRKVAGINIAITKNTGKYWIRGLSDSSMTLVESITTKGLFKDFGVNGHRILEEAKKLSQENYGDDRFIDTMSSNWEKEEKNTETFRVSLGMFAMIFVMSLVFILIRDFAPIGYLFLILSFIFLFAMMFSLGGRYRIQLASGEGRFVKINDIVMEYLKSANIKYQSNYPSTVHRVFDIDLGKGYFKNPRLVVMDAGEGIQVSIQRGPKENAEFIQELMNGLDARFEDNGLKRKPINMESE